MLIVALMLGVCRGLGADAALEERITALYQPLQAEMVALAPDGEHLAFTRHEADEVAVYITAVHRQEGRFRIAVAADREVAFSREKAPARLRFLRWASADRLVFAPTEYRHGARLIGPIYAINRDGTNLKVLAQNEDFAIIGGPAEAQAVISRRPTTIVGFAFGDRTSLLVEARGRLTLPPAEPVPTAMFSINVVTGREKALAETNIDGQFCYDQGGTPRFVYTQSQFSERRTILYNAGRLSSRWTVFDGRAAGADVSFETSVANYYGQRAFPLAFDADPNVVYFASNIGRDTFGVYAFDLAAGRRTGVAIEDPYVDLVGLEPNTARSSLVFDPLSGRLAGVRSVGASRITRWLDPELARLQADLDRSFPGRTVEILQWADARQHLLLRISGGSEPGRYHVFQRRENLLLEVLRQAPWLRPEEIRPSEGFAFDSAAGVHLTGQLTFPVNPRLNPPPLLIDFADGVMGWPSAGFDPDAQAFAELGFVVARINYRGRYGLGLKHRGAIRAGLDRVPVDDVLAAIDWIARHHAVDRKRVVAVGRGLGGFLALRAVQLEPDVFRCAVAINAPADPRAWLEPPLEDFGPSPAEGVELRQNDGTPRFPGRRPRPINFAKEAQRRFLIECEPLGSGSSVLRTVDTLRRPVMLVVDPLGESLIVAQNLELRAKLKRLQRTVEYYEAETGFAENVPAARARLVREMEGFFNLSVYDFQVKIGPTREVK